jgi:putative flippase GtrA
MNAFYKKIDNQLNRFILVGGVNTLISYLLFLILIKIGFYYPYAMLITWCAGIVFNFKTIGRWVFKNSDKTLFIKFSALYCTMYIISVALLRLFDSIFNNISLSGMLTILITSGLSFIGNKKLVFRYLNKQHS